MILVRTSGEKDTMDLSALRDLSLVMDSRAGPIHSRREPSVTFRSAGPTQRVHLSGAPGGEARLEIFSFNGRRVLSRHLRLDASGVAVAPFPPLTSGVYIVRCITGATTVTKRIKKL
jgi:hypothetical protein